MSLSGELKTLKPLDREECDEYRFKVRAVDGGGRFCEANVHVSVRDVNDNTPEFAADPYAITVFENTETGTFVAKLQADDADSGERLFSLFPLHDCQSWRCVESVFFLAGGCQVSMATWSTRWILPTAGSPSTN